MRSILSLGILAAISFLPNAAMAQASGKWRLTGEISGKAFNVDCQFSEKSGELGGICVDVSSGDNGKPGKSHILSKGNVRGQDIRWSYPTKVMIMSVDINFAGKLNGPRMDGIISAKGRQGTFSGSRL